MTTIKQQIPVSQARAHLSELLKKLQKDPETVFEITVNGLVFGELRAAQPPRLIQPGQVLLQALEALEKPEVQSPKNSVARRHDEYLYTKQNP